MNQDQVILLGFHDPFNLQTYKYVLGRNDYKIITCSNLDCILGNLENNGLVGCIMDANFGFKNSPINEPAKQIYNLIIQKYGVEKASKMFLSLTENPDCLENTLKDGVPVMTKMDFADYIFDFLSQIKTLENN